MKIKLPPVLQMFLGSQKRTKTWINWFNNTVYIVQCTLRFNTLIFVGREGGVRNPFKKKFFFLSTVTAKPIFQFSGCVAFK